jgi:hypothetical protein
MQNSSYSIDIRSASDIVLERMILSATPQQFTTATTVGITAAGSDDVRVMNVELIGFATSIALVGTAPDALSISLSDIAIQNPLDVGILVEGGYAGVDISNVAFNNTVPATTGMPVGIAVAKLCAAKVTISTCLFSGLGIGIVQNGGQVTVHDSRFQNNQLGFDSVVDPSVPISSSLFMCAHNLFVDSGMMAALLGHGTAQASNFVVTDNVCQGTGASMMVRCVMNCVVDNNEGCQIVPSSAEEQREKIAME